MPSIDNPAHQSASRRSFMEHMARQLLGVSFLPWLSPSTKLQHRTLPRRPGSSFTCLWTER